MGRDDTSERRFGWIRMESGGTMEVRLLSTVTEEAWDEFQTLVGAQARLRPYLLDFLALECEYKALTDVHVEFAEGIALSANPAFWPPAEQFLRSVQVQRHVSNFLASASAFRDRMAARLAEDGRSGVRDEIRQQTRELYDQNFSYRLMYNLRNYAQHHDLPIDVTNLHIANVSGQERTVTVTFAIKADTLLRSSRIQPKVVSELQSLPDPDIPLNPVARTYFLCHVLLMRRWLAAHASSFRNMLEYRSAVQRTLRLPEGAIPMIFEGEMPNPTFRHFAFDELDLWADMADRLQKEPAI